MTASATHRGTMQIAMLVGLAILLVTRDYTGVAPYALVGLAILVAVDDYLRR